MENEEVVKIFIAKSMKRLKHKLVLIAFGAPMLLLCLNFIFWVSHTIL